MWRDPDQGIVRSATSQCAGARIEDPEFCCPSRGIGTDVILVWTHLICVLWISFRSCLVLVVVHKHIPSQLGILSDDALVGRNCDVDIAALIIAGFDEERAMAGHCQPTRQRPSSRSTAYHNVLIFQRVVGGLRSATDQRRGSAQQRRDNAQ